MALIANVNRSKKSKLFTGEDFFPLSFDKDKKVEKSTKLTPEEVEAKFNNGKRHLSKNGRTDQRTDG